MAWSTSSPQGSTAPMRETLALQAPRLRLRTPGEEGGDSRSWALITTPKQRQLTTIASSMAHFQLSRQFPCPPHRGRHFSQAQPLTPLMLDAHSEPPVDDVRRDALLQLL